MKIILGAALVIVGFVTGYGASQLLSTDSKTTQRESIENSYPRVLVHDEYGRRIEDLGNSDILGAPTTIRITDSEGRQTESKTTPVVLDFFESDYPQNGYYVVTTGEKPGGRNFDEVTFFEFTQGGPIVYKTISTPGYGKFVNGKWFYIPSMNGDMPWSEVILQVLNGYGEEIESWVIGEALQKDPSWKNAYRLTDMEVLETDELILSFEDDCGLDEPYPVCARYLVNVNNRTVYPLLTQPYSKI